MPHCGDSIFSSPLFLGAEPDFEALYAGAQQAIVIGGVKINTLAERIDVRVQWLDPVRRFEIVSIVSSIEQSYSSVALQAARTARILDEQLAEKTRIIAESSRLFTTLVRRVPAALAMLDNGLCYLHASDMWRETIGRADIGSELAQDVPRLERKIRAAIADEDISETWEAISAVQGPDAQERWFAFGLCRWVDENGAYGGYIAVATDRTKDIEKRKSLQVENKDLRHLSLAISHDLRAPIRQIQALSEFLHEDYQENLPADGLSLIEHMRACSVRLEQMLEGLLQLMRLPSSRRNRDVVPLAECASLATSHFQTDIDRLGFKIEIGELPIIRGDRLMMEMFFQNLIQNSLKYARNASPTFSVRAVRNKSGIRVVIADNGPGIPEAQRGRAFQLFEQLSHRGAQGIGAGLALCKHIAGIHQSRLSIIDGEGSGLTLALDIPGSIEFSHKIKKTAKRPIT